jgi:lipopolysaccharide biosynthesis glycosyltransferase
MNEDIDVAFGFDEPYTAHVAAIIASIARYSKGCNFRFIMLNFGVDRMRQVRIETLAPNARFFWVEIREDDLPAFEARRHLTRSTLFRLGLEKLAPPDCERVIYLDGDLTVIGDLKELWHCDLGGAPIGAVVDGLVDPAPFADRWGLSAGGRYFNAGVLLIDLKKVRAEQSFTTVIEFVAKHDLELPFNDQDALNWAFWNNWHALSVAWNVQRPMAVPWDAHKIPADKQLGGQRPLIVHYTGAEKPWLPTGYHPWSWLYWESLARTPFFYEVARTYRVNVLMRLRLRLRWMRRRPRQIERPPFLTMLQGRGT